MLWFARIAEKFDLSASVLYKNANPETLRQLQEIKDRVKKEKDQLNFKVVLSPKIRQLIDEPIELPTLDTDTSASDVRVAGVSFQIADSRKISQPKNLDALANYIEQWVVANIPEYQDRQDHMFNIITSDGSTGGNFVGTINWYADSEDQADYLVEYYLNDVIQDLSLLGVTARVREINLSNDSHTPNRLGQPVIRLEVTENNTQKLKKLPEVDVRSSNVYPIADLLQISPHDGSIQAQDLLARISMARNQIKQKHTRPPEDSGGPGTGQSRWIDPGLDADRLIQYLDALEQMAKYALKMNNATIIWN